MEAGARACRDCGQVKPPRAFKVVAFSPGHEYPRCKTCDRRHDKLVRRQHYSALVLRQGGDRCGICHCPPNGRRLHIDVNERNHKVRGLLCMNCNTGIGKFHHDPDLLLAAVEYLERHGERRRVWSWVRWGSENTQRRGTPPPGDVPLSLPV
jgi:hypothetical protein